MTENKTFRQMMDEKMSKNNEGRGIVVGIGPDYGRYVEIGNGKKWVGIQVPHNAMRGEGTVKTMKSEDALGSIDDKTNDTQKKLKDDSAAGLYPNTDFGVTSKKSESKIEENRERLGKEMSERDNSTVDKAVHNLNGITEGIKRDRKREERTKDIPDYILNIDVDAKESEKKEPTEHKEKSFRQMISERNPFRYI